MAALTRRNTATWTIVCGILALSMSGCGKKQAAPSESIADIQKREGIPVTVMTVTKGKLIAAERVGGTIEGYNQSLLSAALPATVSAIEAQVGQNVNKDAVLVKLAPSIASPYTMAKANYETTEKSVSRLKALADEGGISQDMVDQMQTGYEVAKANLEGARRSENLIAPFAGTIVEVYVPVNTVVDPGTDILKIATLDRVRVKLSVSEAIINRFKTGQKAYIVTDGDTTRGVVEKVSLAADESSHTFLVETVFSNPGRRFRPGMYVSVDVVTREIDNALALPMESIANDGERKSVFVVRDGIARRQPLTVGIRAGSAYEIVAGLAEGDQVVYTGAANLADSAKVKIVGQGGAVVN